MIEFHFPSLGADMDEGMLVKWLVQPGDVVHRGDIVAEVETDKGLVEVESWEEGKVAELLIQPSQEQIPVGTTLALFEPLEAVAVPVPTPQPAEGAPEPISEVPSAPEPLSEPEPPTPAPTGPEHSEPHLTPPIRHLAHQLGVDLASISPTEDGEVTRQDVYRAAAQKRPRVSPRARKVAEDLGVDLTTISPTRPDGMVTVTDIESVATGPRHSRQEARAATEGYPATTEPAQDEAAEGQDRVEAMRTAIARSMSRSKREIPHYYLGTHIDLKAAMDWLEEENEARSLQQRLLPAALLLRATALALRDVPGLNGHWLDDAYHPSDVVHLGVAVSLREGGLVAPAIHDADQMSIDQMMEALRDVVSRARTWRIRSSEMSDPTVTVTNLGDRGVETAFPVIIPPQVAIIGFGKVTDQPVAVDGMVGVHPVVHATLAGDHRVTDGHTGALLLATLDHLLQEPEKL